MLHCGLCRRQAVHQIACSFLWNNKRLHSTFLTHAVVLHKTHFNVLNWSSYPKVIFEASAKFWIITGSQNCYNLLLFVVVHYKKLKIFSLWVVNQTKKEI